MEEETLSEVAWHTEQSSDILHYKLQTYVHYFTSRLDIWDFIPYLKSKLVFSLDDAEKIQAEVTSTRKIDTMIEIIFRKGRHGLEAFFDVLQYDYAEYYKQITGHMPLTPPKGWLRGKSLKRRTLRLDQDRDPLQELLLQVTKFTSQLKDSVTPLTKEVFSIEDEKQRQVDRIYSRLDEQIHSRNDLEKRLHEKELEIKELRERNESLQDRLDRLTQTPLATAAQHATNYRTDTARDSLLQSLQTCRTSVPGMTEIQAQLDKIVQQVKETLGKSQNLPADKQIRDQNDHLRKINEELDRRRHDLKKEKKKLSTDLQALEQKVTTLMKELEHTKIKHQASSREAKELRELVTKEPNENVIMRPGRTSPTTPTTDSRPCPIIGADLDSAFSHRHRTSSL